jgi:signal transduction histidine kinase
LERTNQRVLETIGRGLQWEQGELWMVDRRAKILRCAEYWHVPSEEGDALAAVRRKMTFAAGVGLPGRVWMLGRAEWIPDVGRECGGDEGLPSGAAGARSWIGFPVKLKDEILGVVGFFSAQVHEPDVEMVSTVAALGSQLAQFIERHQLADQFREAQKMEAIGTLAGGIAHDFNNIIAAIAGYTELAKMELPASSKARQHLEEVLVGSTRAAALVRQILAFSRQQDHERKPIQLRHIVREAMTLLRATIPATIDFDFRFDGDLPPVLADATQVHQVVMNLGTNAWHAMKDRPGRLGLTLEPVGVDSDVAEQHPGLQPGRYVRLSVSDTGHGMDRATLSRVFEPFFTTKGPREGTGLGLAVVHGIMQTHEGAITVYSQPGEGTVFRLYFPTVESDFAAAPEDELTIPRGHGERVLYVDDEPPLVAMGRKMLERLGYVVDIRTNPHDAIAAVRAQPDRYDLVITDLAMPEMNGTQLADELLIIRPTLPIVLITGYSANLTTARVQALGIRDLLFKPISLRAIGTAVARILARPNPI